jgi:chemotaxis protein CheC
VTDTIRLSAEERDALQEVGNIGAGHAATALSDLIGRRIMNGLTKSRLCSLADTPSALGAEEEVMCGVVMGLLTGINGAMMMLFPTQDVSNLFKLITGRKEVDTSSPEFREVLEEVGNICICSYINALAEMCDVEVFPTPPGVAYDMVASLLDGLLASINGPADEVLIVQTMFVEGENTLRGFFLLLPDPPTLDFVLKKLGVR